VAALTLTLAITLATCYSPNPNPNPDPYLTGADLNPAMRLPGQASAPTNQLQPLSNPTRDEGAGEKRRLEQEDEDEAAARPLKRCRLAPLTPPNPNPNLSPDVHPNPAPLT